MDSARVMGKDVQVGNIEQMPLDLAAFDGSCGGLVVLGDGWQHRSGYAGGSEIAREIGGVALMVNWMDWDPDAGRGYIASSEKF
jgi:cytosine/adenosine deaminase-related metal-dependent hydrolase